MRILSAYPYPEAGTTNTSVHRSECLRKYASQFDTIDIEPVMNLWSKIVYKINYTLGGGLLNLPDISGNNARLLEAVRNNEYDLIWIDKGNNIYPETLRTIKQLQPQCTLVHYMIDDFLNPYHATKQILDTIPCYDYYIVNRKANIAELRERGCKHPVCIPMSYEKSFHYPRTITEQERQQLGGDIGFIGTYEAERAASLCYLADNGLTVRVWGNGWDKLMHYSRNLIIEGRGIYSDDFCKAIAAFKINLAFLRKKSRDLHTTRSSEIPACGGFMLAERTEEHDEMFIDKKEAAFFSSDEELLSLCKYYLQHDDERRAIAEAGHHRCITSDYSNEGAIRKAVKLMFNA